MTFLLFQSMAIEDTYDNDKEIYSLNSKEFSEKESLLIEEVSSIECPEERVCLPIPITMCCPCFFCFYPC